MTCRRLILSVLITAAGFVTIPAALAAHDEQHHHQMAPGASATGGATIKALTPEQQDQYRSGAGMSLAKPAELNQFPGPRHVLDQAAALQLSEAQTTRIRDIMARMQREAIRLGEAILEKEAALDRLFATRHATAESVRTLTDDIGVLQGRLRATHLVAHVETTAALTPDQVARYASAYRTTDR